MPDPASVGQHMHDAAREMARRGYRVVVYASARGYDEPSRRYPRRETLDGVEIRRLPFASFGKGSLRARLLGGISFLAQATLRALSPGAWPACWCRPRRRWRRRPGSRSPGSAGCRWPSG